MSEQRCVCGHSWHDGECIPELLRCPAAVHFISAEPLLSGLVLTRWLMPRGCAHPLTFYRHDKGCLFEYEDGHVCGRGAGGIDWVIVGGESGPGSAERKLVERCWHDTGGFYGEEHHGLQHSEPSRLKEGDGAYHYCPKPQALEWVRSLREQCVAAGVPFHFKQWWQLRRWRAVK